jgi:23S rRNA (adenine1618-N6)-methyltransferase
MTPSCDPTPNPRLSQREKRIAWLALALGSRCVIAMSSASPATPSFKKRGLHPRNRHVAGYDFPGLVESCPPLAPFVRPSPVGTPTVDFADPAAVMTLNQALLKRDYGVAHWDLPRGYLCPPIPGRADYVHHLADLLSESGSKPIPRGRKIVVLDLGVGANCVYPILGASEYGWGFVGTDIDPIAVAWARQIIAANPKLADLVECRLQPSALDLFRGVVKTRERFAASICNPPFHASPEEAAAGALRKARNLRGKKVTKPVLNFAGRNHELWCEGGESGFIRRMIAQSAEQPALCGWFTTLVSKRETLPALHRALTAAKATEVRTIDVSHGQKNSRILAWKFSSLRA